MNYGVYFSPTSNTEKLVKLFAGSANYIDLSKEFLGLSLKDDDILYLGVPCFGGRAPLYAIEKIKLIKGFNTKAIIMTSYGNRATEDTLIELYDILKANGFIVIAGIEAVAKHSIFNEVASNRPDEKDLLELNSFKKSIELKLQANDLKEALIPGNRPYKERKPGGLIPITNSNCIGCGLCSKLCPANAIDRNDPSYVDSDKCIHCMRCVSVCEFKAKEIQKDILEGMRLRLQDKFKERKINKLYI